jgi:hypothetical protein
LPVSAETSRSARPTPVAASGRGALESGGAARAAVPTAAYLQPLPVQATAYWSPIRGPAASRAAVEELLEADVQAFAPAVAGRDEGQETCRRDCALSKWQDEDVLGDSPLDEPSIAPDLEQ